MDWYWTGLSSLVVVVVSCLLLSCCVLFKKEGSSTTAIGGSSNSKSALDASLLNSSNPDEHSKRTPSRTIWYATLLPAIVCYSTRVAATSRARLVYP